MELIQSHSEKTGTDAVRALRIQKLKLPSNHCYLEYPDGKIILVTLVRHTRNFKVLRVLTANESHQIRIKYNLPMFHS